MIKNLLVLILSLSSTILISQTTAEMELASVETPEQIQTFLVKRKKSKLLTFNEEKHKTKLTKELLNLSKGSIKTVENEFEKTHYKIVNKHHKNYYRVAYIVIKDTDDAINVVRDISNQYEHAVSFNYLAKRYSISENSNYGGDSGWFTLGEMPVELEAEIVNGNHRLNEIFAVKIPSQSVYYIAIATHQPKKIKEVEVIKSIERKG